MNYNSFISNPASGADSTQAQEPAVKSFSSSSSNLNNASEREQSSSLELPSVSIKGVANNVEVDVDNNEVEEFDLSLYALKGFNGNPAVYVDTYHKYNCGSLFGMWLDLTTFADYDEFCAVCAYLHRDEADPELMCQDYENFPDCWYSECGFDEETFDLIKAYGELDEDEQRAYEAFLDLRCEDDLTVEDFREHYCGEWHSEEEFAENLIEELGILDEVPEHLRRFFDVSAYSEELFRYDYDYCDGFVFRVS